MLLNLNIFLLLLYFAVSLNYDVNNFVQMSVNVDLVT